MVSNEMKLLIEQIKQLGKMRFLEAASEEQIAEFEQKYNVKLPEKFKEWLQYSDGGELFLPAGLQMYGVAHKPVIDVTDKDRPNESYTVIGALTSGDPILCEQNSERIAIYNHGAGRIERDEVYADFLAFLNDLPGILGIGG